MPEFFAHEQFCGVAPIELDEFLSICDEGVIASDEHTVLAQRSALARLGKNKRFLVEQLRLRLEHPSRWYVEEAKARHSDQSIVLARREAYYVGVASWCPPSIQNGTTNWDNDFFSYNYAHNHSFSLLSVGLHGSGYTSQNHSLRIPPAHLKPQQKVAMVPAPSFTLAEGDVVFYRKWYDVHDQKPPADFSLSLNLLVADSTVPQYGFDIDRSVVLSQIDGPGHTLGVLLDLAQRLLGEEAREILKWAEKHANVAPVVQDQIRSHLMRLDLPNQGTQ